MPDQIGRYEVRGTVGGGGMGDVFRVHDPMTRRALALKVLKFTYPRALHYFKREFRAVAALSHPNLVQLYDLHTDGSRYFYTMELIDGTDLYIYVNGHNRVVTHAPTLTRPDRLTRLRSSFVQLLRGLAYLHSHGRIHRDIKPSNVLVARDGTLKLVDFGIVKELLPGGVGQSLSQVFGTSTYFSPEQSLGSQVTASTDLYAAGVVLYELLAGTPPFEGESAEVAVMHRTTPPPSLVQRVPGVPPDLALVCMELLKKEPHERPSAVEALEILKAEIEPEIAATEFVGRRSARKALHEALADVQGGAGRLVMLEGPAGIGKTAVIDEFGREARLYHAVLFTGDCVVRDHVPLRGLDTMVERIAEAYRRQTARVLRRMPRAVRAPLIEGFSFLGELLPAREHGTPDGRHALDEGLAGLLAALARKRLMILALEQLHLADESVCDALEAIYTAENPPPVLFVVTLRPDAVEPSGRVAALLELLEGMPAVRRVRIEPFTLAETRQLLEDSLDAAPSWLADHVHAQSQGVPLFVAEMIAALQRDPEGTPPTLADTVADRVRTLPDAARQVLAMLALARRPPTATVLELACDLDADGVHGALQALSRVGLAHAESTSDGEVMAVARHELLMDVVRAGFDEATRAGVHARLARAWEAAAAMDGPGASAPSEVEYHWTAAGRPDAAAAFASSVARGRRADGRSSSLLEMALRGNRDKVHRATLLTDLADSQARGGHFEAAAETLARLEEEDPREGRRWRARRAQLSLLAGNTGPVEELAAELPDDARVPLADVLLTLDPLRAEGLLGEARGPRADLVRARLLLRKGDRRSLDVAMGLVTALAGEERRREPTRRAAYALARIEVLLAQERAVEAEELVDEATALLLHRLPTLDPTRLQLKASRVVVDLDRGRFGPARTAARALVSDVRGTGRDGLRVPALLRHARVLIETGEHSVAARQLSELEQTLAERPTDLRHIECALLRVRSRFYSGDVDGSRLALVELGERADTRRLLPVRQVAVEHALLAARVQMARALGDWRNGAVVKAAALLDSRRALTALPAPPRAWPELVEAVEALVADDAATAAERIETLARSPRRPEHPVVLAVVRTVLATARAHLGRDGGPERRRAERLIEDIGAVTPPEIRAMSARG